MSALLEFYPQIKQVHVAAVLASGGLFALRGALTLAGVRWASNAALRYLSYSIDSVLLTAALMLLTLLPAGLFANGWLTVKLLLLVAYVALGVFALRRAATRRGRALCFAAALAVYLCMLGIARAHHPLGPLLQLMG